MARNIFSIIAGIICSFITLIAIQSIAHMLNHSSVDTRDVEIYRNYVRHEAPETFHLLILSAYGIGSFIGALVATLIALNKKMLRAMTVGGILMGIGINNLIIAQFPSWVVVTAIFIFLPAAYLGARIGKNFSSKKELSH